MSKLNQADIDMRADGYVTAAEVADATGRNLSSIHRAIDDGRIPGRSVGVTYKHRYVDVYALIQQGGCVGTEEEKRLLTALAKLVRKPDAVAKLAATAAPVKRRPARRGARAAPARAGR